MMEMRGYTGKELGQYSLDSVVLKHSMQVLFTLAHTLSVVFVRRTIIHKVNFIYLFILFIISQYLDRDIYKINN